MLNAEDDVAKKALNDARAFTRSGDYAKALERHEWFHKNALSINPALYGVRLSFALADWKQLGDKYSPALASLKSIRNEGLKALRDGTATPDVFADVSRISEQLGDFDTSVAVFKELHLRHPELARKCFQVAQEILFAKREMELITHYVPNLSSYMQMRIVRYQEIANHVKSRNDPNLVAVLKHFDDELVDTALLLIEISDKKNDLDEAKKIRGQTLEVIDDPRLRSPEPASE